MEEARGYHARCVVLSLAGVGIFASHWPDLGHTARAVNVGVIVFCLYAFIANAVAWWRLR